MSTPIDNGVSGADWRKTLDELRDLGESLRSVMDKKERLAADQLYQQQKENEK